MRKSSKSITKKVMNWLSANGDDNESNQLFTLDSRRGAQTL
jgi:hypothetical protein